MAGIEPAWQKPASFFTRSAAALGPGFARLSRSRHLDFPLQTVADEEEFILPLYQLTLTRLRELHHVEYAARPRSD